jgi:hypothetical protein
MADGLERAEPPGKKTVAGAASWEVDAMPRGNIRARLERLRERVGPPEGPGDIEARERALRALETIRRLILERGDEIGRGYGERVGRGEEHLPALVDAKRDALGKTEEGREAGAVAYALEDRTGEGGS